MEHFYENIGENWFSYASFYKDIVTKLSKNSRIAEIGCWKGRSTACLAVEILNANKNIMLYCIDQWKYIPTTEQPVSCQEEFDKVYREFIRNLYPFSNFLRIYRQDSISAAANFNDKTLDFIFIDASHHYEDVKKDIVAWLPKLKKDGIIAGHDYFTRVHPGVKQAVDECIKSNLNFIPEQNVWWHKNV